jgi:hypothetical protein
MIKVAPSLAPTSKTPVAPARAPSRPLLEATERHGYALHYGNARAPLVRVAPDDTHANMWRIAWPDGQSDMANLTRIRDAAAAICERGPPARNRRGFHWKKLCRPEPAIATG